MPMTTYRDYLWLDGPYAFWMTSGYCATLIRDASPDDVLNTLEASPRRPTASGLSESWSARPLFARLDLVDFATEEVIDVTDVGDGWTLLTSGYVGMDSGLLAPLIAEHEVISHFSDVNARSRFMWWRDGQEQISFDTLGPAMDLAVNTRWPPDAYARITALINEVGGIEFDDGGARTEFHHRQGAFALAERLSGVRITQETIDHGLFTAAVIPTTPIEQRTARTEPSIVRPQLGGSATWGDVTQLFHQSLEMTIHADYVKTEHHGGAPAVTLELWFKPLNSWRLHDADGLYLLQSRQEGLRYRNSRGALEKNGGDGILFAWPADLINIDKKWDQPLNTLLPADALGTAVTIADRPAWEFEPPPGWVGVPGRIAFDADTGIALRWTSDQWTEELTAVEVGLDNLPDALFVTHQ